MHIEIPRHSLRCTLKVVGGVVLVAATFWGGYVYGGCETDGGCTLMSKYERGQEMKKAYLAGVEAGMAAQREKGL